MLIKRRKGISTEKYKGGFRYDDKIQKKIKITPT